MSSKRQKDFRNLPIVLYQIAIVIQIIDVYLEGRSYLDKALNVILPVDFLLVLFDSCMIFFLFAVFLIDVYLNDLSFRRIAFCIVALFLVQFGETYHVSRGVLWCVWLVVAFPSKIKIRTVLRCIWITNAVLIMLIVFLSVIHILPNNIQYQHDVTRQSLGFSSPNSLGVAIAMTLMIWSLDKSDSWNLIHFVFSIIVLFAMYTICNSRAAMVFALFFVVALSVRSLFLKRKRGQRLENFVCKASCFAFPFAILIALFFLVFSTVCADSSLFERMNSILSGRLAFIAMFYKQYGIHMFGQEISTTGMKASFDQGTSWSGVDCAYISSSMSEGVLLTLGLVMLFEMFSIYNARHIRSFGLSLMIIVLALFCLTENLLWDVAQNALLSIVGLMLVRDKTYKIGKKIPKHASKEDLHAGII